MNARSFHLAAVGSALQLTRGNRYIDEPAAEQVLIRLGAASLNYRDLLTLQDPASNRDGLVPPLRRCRHRGGHRQWRHALARRRSGQHQLLPDLARGVFPPTAPAIALGAGQTDGVLSEYVVADQESLVAIPDHLSLADASRRSGC